MSEALCLMFLVMEYLTTGKLRRGVGEQKEVKLRLLFLIMFELLKIKLSSNN